VSNKGGFVPFWAVEAAADRAPLLTFAVSVEPPDYRPPFMQQFESTRRSYGEHTSAADAPFAGLADTVTASG